MLDGFCPLIALAEIATDNVIAELVTQGLLARAERDGRQGVIIINYAKHNETKADIERRLNVDRTRKNSGRNPNGIRSDTPSKHGRIPRSESESEPETESEGEKGLPSQAPALSRARAKPSGDHQRLIAHYIAEFERLKGVKPVIGAKGGAGAKRLLEGRSLEEAKAIVDRALSDPWWLDKHPDLAVIAGRINSFIGRAAHSNGASRTPVQPSSSAWKKADVSE
jgi:hypothetical protein